MEYIKPELLLNNYNLEQQTLEGIINIIDKYLKKIQKLDYSKLTIQENLGILLVIAEGYSFLKITDIWDEISYKIMENVRNYILNSEVVSIGLHGGLGNIGLVINLIYKSTGYYGKFLLEFNRLFLQKFRDTLDKLISNIELGVYTNDFDLISGLSGGIQYLFENDSGVIFIYRHIRNNTLYFCEIDTINNYFD